MEVALSKTTLTGSRMLQFSKQGNKGFLRAMHIAAADCSLKALKIGSEEGFAPHGKRCY